jgi:hypothetical protein
VVVVVVVVRVAMVVVVRIRSQCQRYCQSVQLKSPRGLEGIHMMYHQKSQ